MYRTDLSNDYEIKDLGNKYEIWIAGELYWTSESMHDAQKIVELHEKHRNTQQALHAIAHGATTKYLQDVCDESLDEQESDRALRMRDIALLHVDVDYLEY